MDLDRARGDEERLGDITVGQPLRRELADTPLARRQGVDPGQGVAPRSGTCDRQLGAGPGGKRMRSASVSEVQPPAKGVDGLGAPACPAERGAQVGEGPGSGKPGGRWLQHPHCLAQRRTTHGEVGHQLGLIGQEVAILELTVDDHPAQRARDELGRLR